MITMDEAFVDAAAPDSDSGKNGRSLVLKNKLANLHISDDGNLLFGECAGSGKTPYSCSADFLRPDQPTYRCSCPSRKFPCKHCLALLYAYALKKPFTPAPVPADLQAKREKQTARAEKKAEEATKPKQVNVAALAKKVKAQLDGIDILERLTHDLVRLGIGNINPKIADDIGKQANQLGDAYLPGARVALHRYTQLFSNEEGAFEKKSPTEAERIHTEALTLLAQLHAIIKQGRTYLRQRLEDPNLALPTDTPIAAWLGHAWQLAELKAHGLVETDAELVQLAFNSHDDRARQEFIDTGIWMTLGNGQIRVTQTLRPYKALQFIKSEDSFFQVAQVKELCVYPGSLNPRVRWDAMVPRPLLPQDYATIRQHARPSFAAAVKEVKGTLKAPLADKTPILALNFQRIGKVGDTFVIEDAAGERLAMTDSGMAEEPASCHLIPLLPTAALTGQTLLARFHHDLDTQQLRIKPLSIITTSNVIRLTL